MNQVHLTLPRTEAHQILLIVCNRIEEVRNNIERIDYAAKYGQEMGEKVKHDDQTYAHELQVAIARIIDVL